MRHHPLRQGQVDAPHRRHVFGDFRLESGETIPDFAVSYVTHGALTAARDNAVLVLCAIGSTHHRLDFLIAPGRALDPARWFVVCVDAIGNGLTTSPSNSAARFGTRFPRFTIRDMVASQHRLLTEALGLERIAAAAGASMGGMQALQWGVSHPKYVDAIVALVPMARTTHWSRAVNEAARRALMGDPAWNGGAYAAQPAQGWHLWSIILRVLAGRTPQALAEAFPDPGSIVPYLDRLGPEALETAFDANDWIAQSHAYDAHDVGTSPGFDGDTDAALRSIAARTLVMAPLLDLYNPAEEARRAAMLIPRGRFVEIPSVQGHQAANVASEADVAFVDRAVARFLAGE